MKISWKIRKLWHFEVWQVFIAWPVDMKICKWVSWWCHCLTSFHSFCTQKWQQQKKKKSYFSYENVRLALIPLWINADDVYSHISWYEGHTCTITSLGKILTFSNLMYKIYMASNEAMTSTHSFADSYQCFQKCFVKICETSKCHNFLIFQPIFIKFSQFCSKTVTLSSEIKLNV